MQWFQLVPWWVGELELVTNMASMIMTASVISNLVAAIAIVAANK